jgi:thioredoxin 1
MKEFKDFIAGDELVLVDFYAVWCSPCKAMHDILEEYKTMVNGTVRVLKLDIDSPANAAKIQEFRVGSVPTLMFFRSGEMLWRASGVISAVKLKELSDRFLAESAKG